MNPLESIKLKVNPDLHDKLPKKLKKIGDIIVIDFKDIGEYKKKEIAHIYAKDLHICHVPSTTYYILNIIALT